MKPSNILYSCSFPSADWSLQFNKHVITQRYLLIESELHKVRSGQRLDRASSDELRRMVTLGGTITLTRRRMKFTDGSGWYENAVLEIDVDETSSPNAQVPSAPQSSPGARRPKSQPITERISINNDLSSDRTTTEDDARTAYASNVQDLDPASRCLAAAICGCTSTTQW